MQLKGLRQIGKSEIVRNVATLSVGSVVSQLIPVLMSFVLARLYAPQDYGDLGVFVNCAGILTVFSCGRYEYAIVRPQREVDALNLMALSGMIAVGVSLLTFAVFAVGTALKVAPLAQFPCKYGLPLVLLFMAVFQILGNYANRCEKYRILTASNIVRSVVQALTRLGLGVLQVGTGLITGCMAGWAGGCAVYAAQARLSGAVRRCFSWKRIGELAVRYKDFPRYLMTGNLLSALSNNLPVLILAAFYSKESIGYFSMALAVLYLPVMYVGVAIGQVFYKKASAWQIESTNRLAGRFFLFSAVLAILMFSVLLAGGPSMFRFLLGEHWGTVGLYSIYLSPWLMLVFCILPLGWIFDARDRQKTEMGLKLLSFIVRIAVVLAGSYCGLSFAAVLLLYSASGVGLCLLEGYFIYKTLQMKADVRQKTIFFVCLAAVLAVWVFRVCR
ncbi:MAG: oligosaccharide flippase family protein [Bacteroidales bacterium]|nr:oligosaccharide flippase family protein [Bacteroidales bacterium]